MNTKNLNPGKILFTSGFYWKTCTLHAGVKLDLFSQLSGKPLTASELSEKTGYDLRGITMLINALAAMELLEKKEGFYSNTEESDVFLSKQSDRYIGYMIMHHHHLMDSWSHLDQAVTSGKPVRTRSSFGDETVRESFLMGMFNSAMILAPRIVKTIDLADKKHILDLGGGPGTYAIHFCQENPGLQATVFDLPSTRPYAEKTIRQFKMSQRISFKDGDFIDDPLQGIYDVIWMSHILHGENPENCEKLIQKAASALVPGGLLLIHEFILNNEMDGPLFPALFSLNMLTGTPGGQSYSEIQLNKMMKKAGMRSVKKISVDSPNESSVMSGLAV